MTRNAPSIDDCRVIGFRIYSDNRGHLVPIEFGKDTLGMKVTRSFFIFDVPRGAARGGHAPKRCSQILVALAGFAVCDIEDVYGEEDSVLLDNPCLGVYLPPMVWRTLRGFSTDAIIMALCDRHYMPTGHCYDKQEWKERAG